MSRYSDLVLADSPLAYWRMGEPSGTNANDESTNANDGTYNSIAALGVTGALVGDSDTAANFGGSYVSAPGISAYDLGNGPMSFEFWLKLDTLGVGEEKLVDKTGSGAYQIVKNATTDTISLNKAGTAEIVWSTVAITDTTTFHHVVATKTGATSKIYIDGTDVTGTVTDATLVNSAGQLVIGANRGTTSDFLDGSLDEVAIYASVLTPTQVAAHYAAGKGKFGSASPYANLVLGDRPVGYWRLGEASGTNANDESANNYDAMYTGTFTLGATGLLTGDANTALSVSGGGEVAVPTGVSPWSSDFSVELWAKPSSANAYTNLFTTGTYLTNGFAVSQYGTHWHVETVNNGGNLDLTAVATVDTGRADHIIVTRSGTAWVLWVNGVSANATGTYVSPSGGGYMAENWSGTLDEAAVYPTALSPTQVAAHYAAGKGKYGPPSPYASLILADRPAAYLRLGEASGTAARAEVGPLGTYYNTPTLGVAGLVSDGNTAVTFARASAEHVVTDGDLPAVSAGGTTLEAWVKFATLPAEGEVYSIVCWGAQYTGTGYAWLDFMLSGGTYYLSYGWRDVSGLSTIYGTPSPAFTTGTTYHVVVAHDWATKIIKTYINGELAFTNDRSADPAVYAISAGDTLHIGTYNAGVSHNFNGTIDEVAVYGTVLTPAQVLAHYNAGKGKYGPPSPYASLILGDRPLAYWRLGETAGSVAVDETGLYDASYRGGYTLGQTGALADANKAVRLNGSTGNVAVVGTCVPLADCFSIEVWLNSDTPGTWSYLDGCSFTGSYPCIVIGEIANRISCRVDGFGRLATNTFDLSSGTWYHVVWTKNGAANALYINGVADTPTWTNTTCTVMTGSGDTFLGCGADGLDNFPGLLDEVAFYNYPLAAAQVIAHYNTGKGKFTVLRIGGGL